MVFSSLVVKPTCNSVCLFLVKLTALLFQILCTDGLPPQQKAGALNMVGGVADVLLTKKMYKDQAEQMIATHVFKEFHSEFGYLRARVSKF